MNRKITAIAAALAVLVPAAAGAADGAAVNVYSARHYDTDQALYDDFTAQTGIEVNLIEGDADKLIERIKAEGRNSPADVLITVDAGRLYRAQAAGVLAPVESEVLNARVPEHLREPGGRWYGLSQRLRAIVYAKDRVDPAEITSYDDLADPAWRGRVCMRSSTNVYNQSLVGARIAAHGVEATERWAQGLIDNLARPPQGADTDQIKAVAAGECDVTVVNHYYLVRMMKSNNAADQEAAAAVGILFPDQDGRGVHANISGAGVVVTAPHPDNALAFLEYLTTDQAQEYFTLGNYEFPVAKGAKVDPILEGWGDIKTDTINASAYGEYNALAVRLMDRVGWK